MFLFFNNFIGTTDSNPLKFRIYNNKAGRIDTNNTLFGYDELYDFTATSPSCSRTRRADRDSV